jgi:hypothetical protein
MKRLTDEQKKRIADDICLYLLKPVELGVKYIPIICWNKVMETIESITEEE